MQAKHFLAYAALGLMALGSPNTFARTSITTIQIPDTHNVYWNPCDGEDIFVDGDIRLRSHLRSDSSGGTHITLREQLINVVGISLDDGDVYRLVGHTAQSEDYDSISFNLPRSGSVSYQKNIVYQMVPVGSDNDGERYFAKVLIKITTNANGESVVDDFNVKVTCDSRPN
jgi:hypothetical protein